MRGTLVIAAIVAASTGSIASASADDGWTPRTAAAGKPGTLHFRNLFARGDALFAVRLNKSYLQGQLVTLAHCGVAGVKKPAWKPIAPAPPVKVNAAFGLADRIVVRDRGGPPAILADGARKWTKAKGLIVDYDLRPGGDTLYAYTETALLRSTDGGASFAPEAALDSNEAVFGADARGAYVIGFGDRTIARIDPDGSRHPIAGAPKSTGEVATDRAIVLYGEGQVHVSFDGGQTWRDAAIPVPAFPDEPLIAFAGDRVIVQAADGLHVTSDGDAWTPIATTGLGDHLQGVAECGDDLIALTEDGAVYAIAK